MKSRIDDAARRTQQASRFVAELRQRLHERAQQLAARQAGLVAERERLLGA